MNDNNLKQLQKLAQIFNADKIITPEDVDHILKAILGILGTYKKETESINSNTKELIVSILERVGKQNDKLINDFREVKDETVNHYKKKAIELEKLIKKVKKLEEDVLAIEVHDGEDADEEKMIEEIMARIELPEYKETIVTGEEIVDKINELPLTEDNQIDYARIKNAPQIKGKNIISPTVISNAVDLDGSTRQDGYIVAWDAERSRYKHVANSGGGGGGSGDVVGPASATDNAIARFDSTTGKLIQNSAATIADTTGDITAGKYNTVAISGSSTPALAVTGSASVAGSNTGDITATDSSEIDFTLTGQNITASLKTGIDAAKIANGTVSNAEFQYLGNVTSDIQTQLDAKIPLSYLDTDNTLSADSDSKIATQKAVKAFVANAVTGLLDLKGDTDCSANPNYPSALKGDAYYVTVAGKIGGASGKTVEIGDVYVAKADNAGGTEASVGSSWFVLNQNLSGVALTSGTLAQFAATTSAQLAGIMSDETGSGALVFANSPTLVTPALGTPSAVNLTNATALPVAAITPSTSSALGVGSLELGHASDTTLTRASAGVAAIEGNNIVVNTSSPTLGTITTTGNIELGNASDTTLSRSSAGVLAVEGVVIPSVSSTNTITNKDVSSTTNTLKKVTTTTSSATPTPTGDSDFNHFSVTALATNATFAAPSGTPKEGNTLVIRVTPDATPRTLAFNAIYRAVGVTLPSTTVASKAMYFGCIYNSTATKWDVTAYSLEA